MTKSVPMRCGRVLGIVVFACTTACGGSTSDPPIALDPTQAHYGKTYSEWAAAWVQWVYELPATDDCTDPIGDTTGKLCDYHQDQNSPVFFLAGDWGGVVRRTECSVPAGKAIFAPIVVSFQDNGGVPPEMIKTDDQLRHASEIQADSAAQLTFALDGRALAPLDPYRVRAAPYHYTVPTPRSLYDCMGTPGVTGTYSGYTSGYFVLLSPLRPGPHTIAFTAAFDMPGSPPFTLDVTYDPVTIQ